MRLKQTVKRALLVASVCASAIFVNGCSEKVSEEYADLNGYLYIYNVGENEGSAVIIDGESSGTGFVKDGQYYLAYETVRESLDRRYYWDVTEKLLTYASSKNIYDAVLGKEEYTINGETAPFDGVIVLEVEDKAYINVAFVEAMNSTVAIDVYSEPNRIVIETQDEISVATVIEDTKLRTDKGASNSIAADLKKDDKVVFVEENGTWSYVYTRDGIMGYVENTKLKDTSVETVNREESWMEKEPYEYLSLGEKVCLGWHQMEYEGGNESLSSVVSGNELLNVISPTWFKLIDDFGGISSLASKDYVDKAHNMGLQVWALVSDFNKDEDGNHYVNQVVKTTTTRRKLIENLISAARKCDMDGINIDFERVRRASAEGYVQFMRELAVACEKEGLFLSVDMYTPTEDNKYYDRTSVGEVVDYFMIMGYDEHWSGCGQAGSVASLPYVKNGIVNTLQEVDSSRVINGIPFYIRVWYEDTLENAPENSIVVEDPVNGDYALSSTAVGMTKAKKLLTDHGVTPRWIDDLGQYYGDYYEGERFVRIWLEDKESLAAKLNVMKENNLAGVACWKLGLESDEAWEVIGEYLK